MVEQSLSGARGPLHAFEFDAVLAGVFGEQLGKALQAAVATMDWGEGLPYAQRAAEVVKIDTRLKKAREEEAKLVAEAAKAGLQVD